MSFRLPYLNIENNGKTISRFLVSAANTLRLFGASVLGLIINYILLHYKFPELLNTYVYCLTSAGFFLLVCNWGGREYAIKELSLEVSQQKKALGTLLYSRLLSALMLLPIIVLLPRLEHAVAILILVFTRSVGSVFESLLIVKKRFLFSLVAELVLNGLFIVLLLFDENSGNISFFLGEWLMVELLRLLVFVWFFRHSISINVSWNDIVGVFKRSSMFFAVALAGFCCSRADLYVLGLNLESKELSRYAILLNFIILCQVLFGAFFGAFVSNILRLAKQAFHNFRQQMFWSGLIFAILGVFAVEVLSLVFFNSWLDSLFLIMAFINLFSYSSTFTSVYHFTRLNRQDTILKVIVVTGALNILASVFFIPKYGINGAFACNTACAFLTAVLFRISARTIEKQT